MFEDVSAAREPDGVSAPVTLPLILDLLEWLAAGPRAYEEVMEAWRTSCPRLTIWEDAVDGGLAVRRGTVVEITPRGRRLLAEAGRAQP